MVRRYIDTPVLKKFFKAADDVWEIGHDFIDKKMRELKEMTENDIEPSGDTQGNVIDKQMNASFRRVEAMKAPSMGIRSEEM